MQKYALGHVPGQILLRDLATLVAHDRATTASLLAHIAEVKERKLYRRAGQPNMHAYLVNVLRFSEDAASKRLQAAGVARRFPVIFDALADGRLHLSAICVLAPHLLPENAEELIPAAFGRTRGEVEKLIANQFPQPDLPQIVQAIATAPDSMAAHRPNSDPKTAPGQFFESSAQSLTRFGGPAAANAPSAAAGVDATTSAGEAKISVPQYPRLKPLSPERYGLQVTLDEHTHALLREAQDLLEHSNGGRQISNVLTRALELLVRHLKQRRFAETERPRRPSPKPKSARSIPAEVKRAVSKRDGRRCTFKNAAGERCPKRSGLEWDHIVPVAKGGKATVDNIRLRCRAHNQLAAEQEFGEEFMRQKREAAPRACVEVAAAKRKCDERSARTPAGLRHSEGGVGAGERTAIQEKAYEVIPWLRQHSASTPVDP